MGKIISLFPKHRVRLETGAPGFGGLQTGNDLVFGESGFAHDDLLKRHNQYVGRALKLNGSFWQDAYKCCFTNHVAKIRVLY
ncbi:hypothetical protein EOL15_19260 [Citrobacter freundii]|nr:hypothetical protein EOL15_19260 [Citrobacter freundii]